MLTQLLNIWTLYQKYFIAYLIFKSLLTIGLKTNLNSFCYLTTYRYLPISIYFNMNEFHLHVSRLTTKPTNWSVAAAKTQISQGIRPVWSDSSLSAWRKLWSLATHWAHSEDSDQTGRRPRLIWVFAERTVILLVLSWGGSIMFLRTFSPLFISIAPPSVKTFSTSLTIFSHFCQSWSEHWSCQCLLLLPPHVPLRFSILLLNTRMIIGTI